MAVLQIAASDLQKKSLTFDILGNRHTRGSARTTNAMGRSTRGLTSEPVPSAICITALQQ